ncbi:MAG: hypothetical protein ACRDD1_04955 [Planctomycetia bacterium]
MKFDALKGMATNLAAGVSEATASASSSAVDLSQVAAERAVDQMMQALTLAAQRITLHHAGLHVPSVHVTANINLGLVALAVSVDVPLVSNSPPTTEESQ